MYYSVKILYNLVVPEPQHTKPLCLQPRCPFSVSVALFSMLTAIHFNNKPLLPAEKVNDVLAELLLPAELKATQ